MRSRFVLVVGCVLIGLWAVGTALVFMAEAVDFPFRLVTLDGSFVRRGSKTSAAYVFASVFSAFLLVLVLFAIKRSREQLTKPVEDSWTWLTAIKEHLNALPKNRKRRKS